MDSSLVIAEFGEQYLNCPDAEWSRVINDTYLLTENRDCVTVRTTDQTQIRRQTSTATAPPQAFQKGFTPNTNIAFAPCTIDLHHVKMDCEVCPDDYADGWNLFMRNGDNSRANWPFVSYMLTESLKSFEQHLNLVDASGDRVEPTAGVAGDYLASYDGFCTVLTDMVDDGKLAVMPLESTGLTPLQWICAVEDWLKQIPKICLRTGQWKLHMSADDAQLFCDGFEEKYKVNYDRGPQTGDLLTLKFPVKKFSNVQVVGWCNMDGKNTVFLTSVANFEMYGKYPQNALNGNLFWMEESCRVLKLMTDFWRGWGFVDNRKVWTNGM